MVVAIELDPPMLAGKRRRLAALGVRKPRRVSGCAVGLARLNTNSTGPDSPPLLNAAGRSSNP